MQKLIFNDVWKLFDKFRVVLFFMNSFMKHFPRNSDDVCGGLVAHVYVLLGDHKSPCVWTSSFLLNKWLFFRVFNNTSLFSFSLCSPKEVPVSPVICCCGSEVIFLHESCPLTVNSKVFSTVDRLRMRKRKLVISRSATHITAWSEVTSLCGFTNDI